MPAKLKSINPHDQSVVGEVDVATKQDIQMAVRKAKEAFQSWRNTPAEERALLVRQFAKEVLKQKDELAELSTLEMGKPLKQSYGDIEWEQDYLLYYASEGPEFLKEEIIEQSKGITRKVVHEPVGVCAVIAPWNFPYGMPAWGIMPNLVAGNAVVFKPSENTPLCGQRIIGMLKDVGLPQGVVNIVQGDGTVGGMLIDSDIDLVWYTGSTKVGQEIYEKCGRKFIRCLLELGGSSPAIVFQDADMDTTPDHIYDGRFLNCGQVCSAIKRLFIHKKIYKDFVTKFVEIVRQKTIGNPMGEVDFGPLVSMKQLKILESQVSDATLKGAKIEIGGHRPEQHELSKGCYYLPTVLTKVTTDMRVMTEEVFGPVLPVVPFSDTEEVIKYANRTEYGLTAQIYTQDHAIAREVAGRLEAGTVAINSAKYTSPKCPFGGYKKSGIGREGGKYGFDELTQLKYIFENKK